MDIKVYEVKEGDTIIFKFPEILDNETVAKIGVKISQSIPEGIRALIVSKEPEIAIIKKVKE